jgi:hypothetical protein
MIGVDKKKSPLQYLYVATQWLAKCCCRISGSLGKIRDVLAMCYKFRNHFQNENSHFAMRYIVFLQEGFVVLRETIH